MAKPVKIGIVGAGRNTRERHIPGLREIEGVEIVSVSNRTPESSRRAAEQLSIPKAYENWLELVQAPDTDAILIGTWPNLHMPVTVAALEAGKHVLCEARMARDADEAGKMLAAAEARPHLTAQVVPAPFSLGVDATLQRLIAEGYLGELLAVEVLDRGAFPDRQSPLHWRQDYDLSGTNIMSLGIWYETVMRWVSEAVRVSAMGMTFVKTRLESGGGERRAVRVPDHLDVLAELACGAQAHFGISQVAGLAPASQATLFGEQGTLRFAAGKLYGGRRSDLSLEEIPIPPGEAGGWRVEAEFIGAIRGEEAVQRTTFTDGLKYMRFTEAVSRSIQEARAVPV
jgi:predicted dehydrogenase